MNFSPNYLLINFLLITFFITNFSFAQKPVFGIKAGLALNTSSIDQTSLDPNANTTFRRTGILGGIYLDVPLAKKLIFQPGIEIVPEGADLKDAYAYNGYRISFSYIDFPVNILYKMNYPHGNLLAGGGPVIGVPIKNGYGYPLKTEFSINGLIGYEFPIGFSFNLNYTYGVNNVSKNKPLISKISNRYLGITVGYSF